MKGRCTLSGRYLVKDIDVVALCGEAGVVLSEPVDHGAAGDNDRSEQRADAVLEGRKLFGSSKINKQTNKNNIKQIRSVTQHDFAPSHHLVLFLSSTVLLLDILLKFWVCPVEQNLSALAGYQQALHSCSCAGSLGFTPTASDAGC